MKKPPAAFMSYVRLDDEHDDGSLTEFRKRLSNEVCVQTGEEFSIFQDRNDVLWGENWKERIEKSLDAVTFLIPIITPSFFKSPECRYELEKFIEREEKLNRKDLILPLYYIDCPLLNDEAKRATDKLAQVIAQHQYADWRNLRFEDFTSSQVRKKMAQLAVQIRDALERVQVPQSTESVDESVEVTRRPSAKTEPPTRTVDQMLRGDYPTIMKAIEAADPGDRILVRPGLYEEGLVIDKPLEIIGQGKPDEVVVRVKEKNTILFKTTMGCVANLTLRQMSDGKWYCVDIAQGRLELDNCDITSQSSACVAIHGGADPRLRRNRIHDGKSCGVFVYENGQGVLEDNDIFGNALAGVEITEGSNPTLRRNRIHDGKTSGVFVHDNGQGVLEDNDIFGNALTGAAIAKGSNPTLRRNRIHDGKTSGVFVYENGQGVLEDNDIFGNTLAGVEIKEGSNPTLRRNRIHDGKTSGVFVHDNGQGVLEDNDIFGNTLAGAAIAKSGNPTLRRNRIHDGKSSGVFVYDNGQGVLEDNDIFGNTLAGVEIKEGSNPTLRRNRIHDGKSSGVFVYENGQGVLEDNDIFGNAFAGAAIAKSGNPTLRRNRINKNGYEAVWVYQRGAGTFEYNDLRDNARGAWNIFADSEQNLKRANNRE